MSLPTSAHKQPQLDFLSLSKLSTVEKKPRKTSTVEKITSMVEKNIKNFNRQKKKVNQNFNRQKNNFDGRKKTTKILTVEKIISTVEKNNKNIDCRKKKIEQVQSQISTVEKKQKKNRLLKKKRFFFAFFFDHRKTKLPLVFCFVFLSRTERKVEKSV